MKIYLLLLSLIASFSIFAQTGIVRGTVIEDETGDPMIGVTIHLDSDRSTGVITDYDGNFEIKLPVGVHTLALNYISFEEMKVTDVEVKKDEVNFLGNVRMKQGSELLEEVVVTAEMVRTSEAALMTLKRKSTSLIDGISSSRFKKIGDSDAASAVKRVTGVSVEGGKYVYVRGLGDRYTKSMLNSLDIPGLDPDRNSLQIDIFPTNLISNMIIYKTSVAELPADFTGGAVNIETIDFPQEKTFKLSFGMSYNPAMHFNDENLVYEGGNTDWLGFDDGTRAIPSDAADGVIVDPFTGTDAEVGALTRDFEPIMHTSQESALPDLSFGVSYGDQIKVGENKSIGYIFSGAYKSSRRFYNDIFYGEYQNAIASDEFELVRANTQEGAVSENNVLLAGLAGVAYKTKNTKHRITFMRLQNGQNKAANFDLLNDDNAVGQSGYTGFSNNLEYSERSVTNLLFNGEYSGNEGKWNLEWRVSPTLSTLSDPDLRKVAFTDVGANRITFAAGAAGIPTRIWRDLEETNLASRIDFSNEYKLFNNDAEVKIGAGYVIKERDYEILRYDVSFFGLQPNWTGDFSEVLTEENLYPNGTLYYTSANTSPNPNEYNSVSNNFSAYISNEFNPTKTLKATVGLRMEVFDQVHSGRDERAASHLNTELNNGRSEAEIIQEIKDADGNFGFVLDNENVLDATDFFPSLNLVQALGDKQNIRFSYSRSIARPSFKELSFAQILDPVTNRRFNGGLFVYEGDWDGNLTETRINNFDFRWELFLERGQVFSVSLFYKQFDDPIELVRIPTAQTSAEFQPRNVGDGEVYGVELELRKSLEFISPALNKLAFNTNVTFAQSNVEMTDTEFNSRKNFEKEGQTIERTRRMAGQAPYIINAGLIYNDVDAEFDMGLYYNVKGETLTVVGGGLFPDVFSEPFHSLKFTLNKAIGAEKRTSISLEIDNILLDVREEFFEGFEATPQLFSRFSPGISFGVGVSYDIF